MNTKIILKILCLMLVITCASIGVVCASSDVDNHTINDSIQIPDNHVNSVGNDLNTPIVPDQTSDNLSSYNISEDQVPVDYPENNIPVHTIEPKELQTQINNAENNSGITIHKNIIFNPENSPIEINRPLTLDFNGNTIFANNTKHIFNINSDDVTIKNCNILLNINDNTTSIITATGSNVTFENVKYWNVNECPCGGKISDCGCPLCDDLDCGDCPVCNGLDCGYSVCGCPLCDDLDCGDCPVCNGLDCGYPSYTTEGVDDCPSYTELPCECLDCVECA